MNRRTCIRTGSLVVLISAFSAPSLLAKMGEIGKLSPSEFMKMNEEAGSKVKAITPDNKPLDAADTELLKEIALGGMMQLEAGKVAVAMASSADVKLIAQAEVEEQTILSAKLKEIAVAGGAMLPTEPDSKAAEMLAKLKAKSGSEFDKAYLKESGVKGHQMLQSTMEKVQSKAASPILKQLASTALPLIKTHLQASKDEAADMK